MPNIYSFAAFLLYIYNYITCIDVVNDWLFSIVFFSFFLMFRLRCASSNTHFLGSLFNIYREFFIRAHGMIFHTYFRFYRFVYTGWNTNNCKTTRIVFFFFVNIWYSSFYFVWWNCRFGVCDRNVIIYTNNSRDMYSIFILNARM